MHFPGFLRAIASSIILVALAPIAAHADPLDVSDDIFYQFMPIAWRDSDNDQYRYGDFNGMTASLDYLQSLGVTAVWMNPIFPSAAYHGYQHGDASTLDSKFGTEAQFLAFVSAAHAKGIKVYLDFVAYGISQNSTWYQSARNNPSSPYDQWLAFTNGANTQYTGSVYNTWSGASVGFIHWNLNNANPVNLQIAWGQKWLDPNNDGDTSDGVDGFRLDHAYSNAPEGWGATINFWTTWKQGLQAKRPNVFTFAEQGDWGNYGTDLLPAFDGAFTKPFEFAARSALSSETAANLYSSMAATLAALPGGKPQPGKTFLATIADHDVDRLASNIGASGATVGRSKAAAAVLMLQPLPPIIYYGDELGMTGTKQSYGSDADDIPMREPMKWNKVAGAPMSNYLVRNTGAYNNRFERDNDGKSVEEQSGVLGSLLETYRTLGALRKNNAALRRGLYNPVTASGGKVWAFTRDSNPLGGPRQTLLVAINVSGSAQSTSLNFSGFNIPAGGSPVTDIVTSQNLVSISNANAASYTLNVPAYSYRVLSVTVTPPAPPAVLVDGISVPTDLGAPSDGAGTLLATQACATSFGDNTAELDQMFARSTRDGLYVGITGNLPTDGTALALFIDTGAPGQNILNTASLGSPPGGLAELSGTRFDVGFAPSSMFLVNVAGALYVDYVSLPSGASASKTYLGAGSAGTGTGVLAGGVNPSGVQVALDRSNTAGVTGSSAVNAATASKGFEFFIPYAQLGLASSPAGCTDIRLAAFIVRSDGTLGNQVLPALPAGSAELGLDPNFTTKLGDQFATFTLPPAADFTGDSVVDDADFVVFAAGYNVLECDDPAMAANCPADLDGNGFVDDADFVIFAAAYNALVCP
ncbi:MAG: alpha-amylase family glycosyl hydrolase [Phycisphaerales bacterium]